MLGQLVVPNGSLDNSEKIWWWYDDFLSLQVAKTMQKHAGLIHVLPEKMIRKNSQINTVAKWVSVGWRRCGVSRASLPVLCLHPGNFRLSAQSHGRFGSGDFPDFNLGWFWCSNPQFSGVYPPKKESSTVTGSRHKIVFVDAIDQQDVSPIWF